MSRQRLFVRLAALSGIAILPGCAGLSALNAFSDEGVADAFMEVSDGDKNGVITYAEFEESIVRENGGDVDKDSLRQDFDKWDGNKDGSVTKSEIIAYQQTDEFETSSDDRSWREFQSVVDGDEGGSINLQEYSVYWVRIADDDEKSATEEFDKIDGDGDGQITKSEYITWLNNDEW